ncbi:Flavodoxin-like fold family protein [Tritrichomonas foetus]|uniref:Flavodoxin-like fold family protein n=1 Tax=Tritrichomonas foetus TaxID=1144522 RepID=A0A1J4KWB8_9EUKA|nr:Flavodoxin-like fold family protein [Tritrichomonas foetus]|eukprot:OHT13998.1 Flavodoxin-like fold family protein [Tritrichomonas foetus]
MRVLILIAHGNFDARSNSHKLAFAAEDSLKKGGHEVRVVDLCKAGFNMTASIDDCIKVENKEGKKFNYQISAANPENLRPNVHEQQENIKWCTHVIVCAPIWYHSLPSCFYAYYERVFTRGFSYDSTHALGTGFFKDKKVMICVTAGGPEIYYTRASHFPIEATLYPVHVGHFYYNGFQIMRSQLFSGLTQKDEKDEDSFIDVSEEDIEKWKKTVLNIDKRPLLPIQPRGHAESDIEVFAKIPNYSLDEAINQK